MSILFPDSEDGIYPDANVIWTLNCPPQKQASVEIGPGLLRRYWRLSANSAGPSYPTVATLWGVRGIHRST